MIVIPAQAGIQTGVITVDVGPRLRGDDGNDAGNNHANRSKFMKKAHVLGTWASVSIVFVMRGCRFIFR